MNHGPDFAAHEDGLPDVPAAKQNYDVERAGERLCQTMLLGQVYLERDYIFSTSFSYILADFQASDENIPILSIWDGSYRLFCADAGKDSVPGTEAN